MYQPHDLLFSDPSVRLGPSLDEANLFSSGAALALVAWDTVLTLDDEVDYIWSGAGRWHVKWIYLFARWFGLLTQICLHIWFYFLGTLNPAPMSTCEAFYTFEAVSFQLLQLSLDAILVLRISAIYQRHRHYIAIAIAIVFFELFISAMTQALSLPKSTVGRTCTVLHTPTATLCPGIGMVVSQTVLLTLTYRGKALLQPAARRSKLITAVVRDGILVFAVAIGTVLLILFLFLLFNQVFINLFWPWMLVIPSVLTPRIILNIQMAARPTESILEFTTNFGTLPNDELI